jgi:two-component system nitrogen regulation sensor histidine kinase GlnL
MKRPSRTERSTLDAVSVGIVVIDSEGNVDLLNPAAEDLLSVSERAARGRAARALGPEAEALALLGERAVAEGRAVRAEEVRWTGPLGGVRWLSAAAAPRFDERGRAAGATLVLRERDDPLGLAAAGSGGNHFYATLAAGLAHEVRNPLGGIRGAAQLLQAELPRESPLHEHLAVILREVGRLSSLTERLLDLGRPAAAARAPVNIHQVLDDVLAACCRDELARGVQFERAYDPSLPALRADSDALARLFHNLVRNAIEALRGRGRITLSTGAETGFRRRARTARSSVVRVTISDDGPGIPAELQAQLFLPFATRKPGGTGLGLALARKVALDHGGWIVCASEPGRGTSFTVYLPEEGEP